MNVAMTIDLNAALAAWPIFGGSEQYGIVSTGDRLVNQLADGTPLDSVWDDYMVAMELQNEARRNIVGLVSFFTTATGEAVPQNLAVPSFEETTEYGVPKSAGVPADALVLGYTFKDHGVRSSFTWKFLRNANRGAVDGIIESIISADNKLTTGSVMRRLFDPAEKRNEFGHRVFGLWNGTDGIAPPAHLGREFPSTESHYLASGANAIDSMDLEDSFRLITRKGYGTPESGSQLVVLCNPDEAEKISAFRSGQPSRPSGPVAIHDFIPSVSAPPYLQPENIIGQPAPADYQGIPVIGSYGPAFIIQSNYIPSGYVAIVATNGINSPRNPIGFREHANPAYRGLLLLPGQGPYPLVDSFHLRSFGVGTRHRGSAVCVQVTTNGSYAKPADTAIPI
jgi:hypothetical protein